MTTCPFCGDEVPSRKTPGEPPFLRACRKCLNPILAYPADEGLVAEPLSDSRDIREDIAPGSVVAGILASLGKEFDSLPVLPEIPQRILGMVHDPLMSLSELAQVMSKDAVVSVKILKMANSAFYSSIQEIRNLNVACARLGLRVIANTVCAVANANLYRTTVPQFREMMQRLWQHSLATAHCADELGLRVGGVDKNVLFEGGLVHDIGKAVLVDLITVKYKGSVGRLRQTPELLLKVVQKYHALVGLHVAQHWNLGSDLCFSTYFHDSPDSCPPGDMERLVDLVALANAIAHAIGYGFGDDAQPSWLGDSAAARRLGMDPGELPAICDGVKDHVATLVDALGAL
jgi:putative nucleotidyltransferase with HDIG domain